MLTFVHFLITKFKMKNANDCTANIKKPSHNRLLRSCSKFTLSCVEAESSDGLQPIFNTMGKVKGIGSLTLKYNSL